MLSYRSRILSYLHAANRISASLQHNGPEKCFKFSWITTSSEHRRTVSASFFRYFFLPCSVSAFFSRSFLLSPVTIGTTVAWVCGVFSSVWRTADTILSFPNVSYSHSILSRLHSSSLPSACMRCISSEVPGSITCNARTWLWFILRFIPAFSIRYCIACVRVSNPSGNSIRFLFRCLRSRSALAPD